MSKKPEILYTGDEAQLPNEVRDSIILLEKILSHAGVKSLKGEHLSPQELKYIPFPKAPKELHNVILIGTNAALNHMGTSVDSTGEGWNLTIQSDEGKRVIRVPQLGMISADNLDSKKGGMYGLSIGARDKNNGDEIKPVGAPATLMAIFVDARLQESGTSCGSFNAH